MQQFDLYRRRLIPDECILLKDDRILSFEGGRLVSAWDVLRPKKVLHHGISCFFFEDGIKLSKFYDKDSNLIYWYTDIIDAQIRHKNSAEEIPFHDLTSTPLEEGDSLIVTDLLADILIYPDGFVKVVDLGEISDALTQGLLDLPRAAYALKITDTTLEDIYRGRFSEKQAYLESFEQ